MIRAVGIVVPAANEQDDIGNCLDSLIAARRHLHEVTDGEIDVRIVVVLDCCVDGTAAVVGSYPDVESLPCHAGRVGTARALGTESLLAGWDVPRARLWLANTDADSVVPRDWLARMVKQAERGAHLVLGTVMPLPGLPHAAERTWFRLHRLRDGHPHVHGANFGIRADIYAALGGWPRLATGEDLELQQRAQSHGQVRITRTARIPVLTSARTTGRAPGGFSSYLRGITTKGDAV